MLKAFDIVVIAMVLLVQIAFVMPRASSGNIIGGMTYRQQERKAATDAMMTNRTPATVAALDAELQLASRYHGEQQLIRSGVIFGVLLILDGFGIYYWRRYARRNAA